MSEQLVNIVIAGLGGQGVLTASDLLAQAAFLSGYDVKKSEVHGMSQRGGSVTSDVRFGERVFSPMTPVGEANFVLVLEETQVDLHRHLLRSDGRLLTPSDLNGVLLPHPKSGNTAMVGLLSPALPIDEECWQGAIRAHFPERMRAMNEEAFFLGRKQGERGYGQ